MLTVLFLWHSRKAGAGHGSWGEVGGDSLLRKPVPVDPGGPAVPSQVGQPQVTPAGLVRSDAGMVFVGRWDLAWDLRMGIIKWIEDFWHGV